jgi:hypothetical protein
VQQGREAAPFTPPLPARLNIGIVWGFFGAFVVATWLVLSFRRYERR